MKLKVICVAYERPNQLLGLIASFVVQTDPRWELNIIYDGPVPDEINRVKKVIQDKRIFFANTETRNAKFGHPNRRAALESLIAEDSDYVLMTNDDNYYAPTFVAQMLKNCNDNIGMVYCDTIHSYQSHDVTRSFLFENGIDMGAFIVRFNIAKEIGFKHDHFSADGTYCTECRRMCASHGYSIVQVPRPLFVHN